MSPSKTIFIRDDDTSFFTSPEKLERIYGKLWAAGIPVNLAVIPAPRGDVRVLHREGQPFDPSIPTTLRGQERHFPLWENAPLCEFLNEKAKQGLVEICLHGYDHGYHEFDSDRPKVMAQKLDAGKRELVYALPNARIKTFVAPYDVISPDAFELITERGYHLATNIASVQGTPYADLGAFETCQMATGRNLYASNEYFFSHHAAPEACEGLAQQRLAQHDLLIVTNHYWTFFYDWNGEWTPMIDAWDHFVDTLLALPDARFSTFARG